jgi:hypothetical protein
MNIRIWGNEQQILQLGTCTRINHRKTTEQERNPSSLTQGGEAKESPLEMGEENERTSKQILPPK